MHAVAARIGMTKGAPYARFCSTEGPAEALVQRFAGAWRGLGDVGEAPGTAAEALREPTATVSGDLCDDM